MLVWNLDLGIWIFRSRIEASPSVLFPATRDSVSDPIPRRLVDTSPAFPGILSDPTHVAQALAGLSFSRRVETSEPPGRAYGYALGESGVRTAFANGQMPRPPESSP